ncbi:YbgC/FadM family acyl-CoA thioesterase [Hydrogenimonas sp.]
MKIRIYYEDTDAAGIVYYANYLKFCERARSELFFEAGLSPQSESGYFVVKSLEAAYHAPACLGDMLDVGTTIVQKGAASLVLEQKVLRDGEALFSMKIKLAFLNEGRPARIPPAIQSLLSSWEKGAS